MKIALLTLIFCIPLFCAAEEPKTYGAIYYSGNTITPCVGAATVLVGGPSEMAKLEQKRKSMGSPIFIVFEGFERTYPEPATYRKTYQLTKIVSIEKLDSGLQKCKELI